MSDNTFNIPKSLITALKAGEVVPFIGAGVSIAVKKKNEDGTESKEPLFLSWKGFVKKLANALKDEQKPEEAQYVESCVIIKQPKYLEAMQHAQGELGKSLWYQIFDESFDKSKSEAYEDSLKLPELIWELSNNLIITTNVDRVFQWTCPNSSEYRALDVQNVEYAQLQKEQIPKRPTAWYLHGSVDHKERVIFTLDQYKAFYEERNNEAKLQTLINLLTQRTFLFIGFSLDDAYIREQLEYIHRIYKGGADSFYILLRKSEIEKANLPDYVKPIPFSDFGKPLEDLIEKLVKIAKGNDDLDAPASSPPPDSPLPKTELQVTTLSTLSGTFSSSQKLFKSVLGEKHFNVPFASKGEAFVGREGLREKIWQSLNQTGRAAIGQAVSIKGIGGLGKTQLAVEYAHKYRDRYENGVFWLTADENIDIQLIKIGEDLRWISQSDTGFDQAQLVRNRFRKLSDCLIIFDNVDDEEEIKNYLPERDAHPHILITSREEQDGYYPINLDTLSRNEARELLTQIAERTPDTNTEKEALENILTELDGLPLAVELVGGYLFRRKNISFQDYYGYLENETLERLEKRFSDKTFTQHNKSIIRTLKISEKLFGETRYLEEVLDVLAWSGKSSMGYPLLRELVGTEDDFALKDALGVALELHFIKKEEEGERFTIHRLLAKVRRYEKPLEQNKEWHQQIVKRIEKWFEPKVSDFKDLAEFEAEIAHLREWQELTVKILPGEAVLLTALRANPLHHRGNFPEASQWLKTAYQNYHLENVDNEKLFADLNNYLGVNYSNLGNQQKALELKQKALEMRQELFGEKHPEIAESLNNLGASYGELGNHQKALEYHQKALEMHQELFGEKHPDIANSLSNLGVTYGELGNHQKALELKQKALEMHQELFGEKHPDIADSLNNLGVSYNKLGNHQKALEYQQKALEMRQELFGEKHPDIATSFGNLGYTYDKLGNQQKALEYQQKALEMRQELFGEKHPDIATSFGNLGYTYDKLGNHQKAVEYFDKALKMRQEILGNRHPHTISSCRGLIFVLSKTGRLERSIKLAREFLSYVPPNNPSRKFFEEHALIHGSKNKKKGRHKK